MSCAWDNEAMNNFQWWLLVNDEDENSFMDVFKPVLVTHTFYILTLAVPQSIQGVHLKW